MVLSRAAGWRKWLGSSASMDSTGTSLIKGLAYSFVEIP